MTGRNESPESIGSIPTEEEFFGVSAAVNDIERRAVEEMALINAINEAANRGDSLQKILTLLTHGTVRLFSGFGATLYLLGKDKLTLDVQYLDLPDTITGHIESKLGKKLNKVKIPLEPGAYFYEILQQASPRILSNRPDILSFLTAVVQAPPEMKHSLIPVIDDFLGINSVMLVPLVNAGEAIGLIDIASKNPFINSDLERLQSLARQITGVITRKQMEEQLRWERDFNAQLVESSPVLFAAIDAEGRTMMINSTMLKVLGYARDDVIGKDFLETFVPVSEREEVNRTLRGLFEEGKTVVNERRVSAKDGADRIVEWHAQRVTKSNGEVDYYFGVGIDLTERKILQEQLIMADRLAAMGELVSGVAHELNNPLTGVIGFSELLLEKNIPENLCEDVAIIHHEAQRAAEVVKNMLAFARKHAPSRQNININSSIARVLSLRTYEHKVNNIKVVTQLSHDLPDVYVDVFQLQQVFLNIIINAEYFMKQTHNGGVLSITTEKEADKVRVTINDNGPGIKPENLHKIFDPFFTTKEVGVGTGLGLSLSHGIIKEHGGEIYAKSKPQEGATFIIELPVQTYCKGNGSEGKIFSGQGGTE